MRSKTSKAPNPTPPRARERAGEPEGTSWLSPPKGWIASVLTAVAAVILIGVSLATGWLVTKWELDARLNAKEAERVAAVARAEKAESQRDTARAELDAARAASAVLALVDSDFILLRRFDLEKEAGAVAIVGECEREPCYSLQVESVDTQAGRMKLRVTGKRFGLSQVEGGIALSFPVRNGCGAIVNGADVDLIAVVEDDRVASVRLVLALREGTGERGALHIESMGCPLSASS